MSDSTAEYNYTVSREYLHRQRLQNLRTPSEITANRRQYMDEFLAGHRRVERRGELQRGERHASMDFMFATGLNMALRESSDYEMSRELLSQLRISLTSGLDPAQRRHKRRIIRMRLREGIAYAAYSKMTRFGRAPGLKWWWKWFEPELNADMDNPEYLMLVCTVLSDYFVVLSLKIQTGDQTRTIHPHLKRQIAQTTTNPLMQPDGKPWQTLQLLPLPAAIVDARYPPLSYSGVLAVQDCRSHAWTGLVWVESTLQVIGLVMQTGHGGRTCPHPGRTDEIKISSDDRQSLMKIHIRACGCGIEEIRCCRLEEREVTLEEVKGTKLYHDLVDVRQPPPYDLWQKKRRALGQKQSARKPPTLVQAAELTAEAVKSRRQQEREVLRIRGEQVPPEWDSVEWDAAMQALLDNATESRDAAAIEQDCNVSMDLGYNDDYSDEEDPHERWQDKPMICYRGTTDGERAEREWALLNEICSPREMGVGVRHDAVEDVASAFRRRVLRQMVAFEAASRESC
ncbi:hypothetical protein C8R43DRAFT_946132 [Mycena crocata]|nr:hypothetical protein C8R43DRAFT_946132 [Mycena crocata]